MMKIQEQQSHSSSCESDSPMKTDEDFGPNYHQGQRPEESPTASQQHAEASNHMVSFGLGEEQRTLMEDIA